MAGYLASREHEVEPAQSETISYFRPTGYEKLSVDALIAALTMVPMDDFNLRREIIKRLRPEK